MSCESDINESLIQQKSYHQPLVTNRKNHITCEKSGKQDTMYENTNNRLNFPTMRTESREEEAAAALLLAAGRKYEPSLVGIRRQESSETGRQQCYVSSAASEHEDQHSTGTPIVTSYVSPVNSAGGNDQLHEHSEDPYHFSTQLHQFLCNSEFSGSIVEWLPHGRSWRVLRWESLTNEILVRNFPQLAGGNSDTFMSFVNAWGFKEIRSGSDRGSFQHTLFLRGRPELCRQMRVCVHPYTSAKSRDSSHNDESDTSSGPTYSDCTPVIIYPPSDSYSPSQALRYSYSMPISQKRIVHQNVFRQRIAVSPSRRNSGVVTPGSNGETDSPWVSMQQYQNKHSPAIGTAVVSSLSHSESSAPGNTNSGPYQPLTKHIYNRENRLNRVRYIYCHGGNDSSELSPMKPSHCEESSAKGVSQIPSSINLPLHHPNPSNTQQIKQEQPIQGRMGICSSRGRSKRIAVSHSTNNLSRPDHIFYYPTHPQRTVSELAEKRTSFTVSSRGRSKRVLPTKHRNIPKKRPFKPV